MAQRSIIAVILLSIFTFGIYSIIWFIKTKNEMVARGADIPTAILFFLPFVNIYWMWKWCGGVELVTGGRMSQVVSLLLIWLLGPVIGIAIAQDAFNKVSTAAALPRAYAA